MTDKNRIEVKKKSRRKPGEKLPPAITEPRTRVGYDDRGVTIVGGGDQRGKGDPAKTMGAIEKGVNIVRRLF